MKYSQFNSLLKYNGERFALYNSFEQKVIFIEEALKNILEEKIRDGIDTLRDIHPAFFDYLIKGNFLVSNDLNEVEKIKEISRQIDENPRIFMLTINPTMNCNFKCWYCYETHIRKSRLDNKVSAAIRKFISTTADNPEIKYFNLSFFGGEPLMYFKKDVQPVIEHYISVCKDKDFSDKISFTTNGYLITNEFIDYFKEKNIFPSFQITFDGYEKDHDEVRYAGKSKGSYDVIVKNIKKLLENNFFVRARINYTNKNVQNCFKIIDDFLEVPQQMRDENLVFDFHRVWQNDSLDNASDIMKENAKIMREKGFKTSVKYSPNNVLQSCYADKRNSVVINYNGDIFKCTARDFLPENRVGYLSDEGKLIWNDGYLDKRMNAKFNNKVCLSCKILPLCNGGCSQHALEHLEIGDDYCVFHADRGEIERIIQTKIEEIIDVQSEKK
jgi:uncharacterized protein